MLWYGLRYADPARKGSKSPRDTGTTTTTVERLWDPLIVNRVEK